MAEGASRPSGTQVADGLCKHILNDAFFKKHWEKVPLHYRAAEHGKDANLLPNAISADDAMTIIRKSEANLKIFKQGNAYDLDNFQVAYLDGASLVVNQADRTNPVLYELSRKLGSRHFMHVFCVVYLTPPKARAVRLHNDDQDVLLMQVWGKKKWIIRNSPKKLPYTEEMLGKDDPVPPELVGEPTMEFTMEPHDVLYIPRGYLHEAHTGDESSLHVTVTMPTSDYCWGIQVLKHTMGKVNWRVLGPGFQDLGNESLAPMGRAGPRALSDKELDAKLQDVFKAAIDGLSVDSVLDSFDNRMQRTNAGQEMQFGRMGQAQLPPAVTEDCRVRLMQGITCWCEPGSEMAHFSQAASDRRLEMPIVSTASELIRSLTTKPKSVTDLPCQDRFERLCVLQLLLQHGVLQLVLRPEEENSTGLGTVHEQ